MELSPMDRMILPGLFSPAERQTLYQTMCAVRMMGQHAQAAKLQVIREAMAVCNISSADQVQSRRFSQPQMMEIMKRMDDGKKCYFAKFCSLVALAGGNSQKETMFLNWLYAEIEVPDL